MSEPDLRIWVACYAGYRSAETPRQFVLDGRQIGVAEILDGWVTIDYRYFKVRGDDSNEYTLRHNVSAGQWELTMLGT